MPGKGGIAPVQSRRSVPVLMPRPLDVHDNVAVAGRVQRKLAESEIARGVQNDCQRVSRLLLLRLPLDLGGFLSD